MNFFFFFIFRSINKKKNFLDTSIKSQWPIKINSFLPGRAQKNLKCIIKYGIKIRVLHGKNYFFNFSTLKHIIIHTLVTRELYFHFFFFFYVCINN